MRSLREATDAEKIERDRLAHSAWGARLSVERFVAREIELRETPFSRAEMRTWIYADGARPLASCETYRMRARAGATRGWAYAIASVFTEPALRKRGHATAMLDALMDHLARTDPEALAAVLYSDVGVAQYARSGFVARPAFDWIAPSLAAKPAGDPIRTIDGIPLEGSGAFAIDASAAHVAWHLHRESIYARELSQPRLDRIGAKKDDEHIVWFVDWKNDKLLVLHLRAARHRDLLLDAARAAAHELALPSVTLWETEQTAALPAPWTRSVREGSIPMLRPLRAGVDPDAWTDVQRVHWV